MNNEPSDYVPILGMLLSTAFLSFGSVLIRWSEVDAYSTGFLRGAIAVLFFIPIVFIFRKRIKRKNFLVPDLRDPAIFIAGAFLGIEVLLFNVGVQYTTIANANLLINLAPFFIIALNSAISRTMPSKRFLTGIACTVVGLTLLLGKKFSFNSEELLGDIFCLLAAVGYAIYLFVLSKYIRKQNSFYVAYQTSWGFLAFCFLAILVFNNGGEYYPVTLRGWSVLIALALLVQIFGHGLVVFSIAKLNTNIAVALLLVQPVIAAVYGYSLFNEVLTIKELAGMFVVITGIYIVQYKAPKRDSA